jgi:hypothetical protein
MIKLNRFQFLSSTFALALLLVAAGAKAGEIRGNSGNNFTLTPTATPGVFTLTHPGVARVSLLGNCTFDGTETLVMPATPDQPLTTVGTFRFVSADGSSTLDAEVEGTGMPDPANPNFVNLHYTLKFTGGTGKMANARGKGQLTGTAMLTSPSGGTTTFTFRGQISTHGRDNDNP